MNSPTLLARFALQLCRINSLLAYRNADWRKLPIKECGEPLVLIPEYLAYPYYVREMHLGTDEAMYLRESVLEKVINAHDFIKQNFGWDLKVYDGWRSYETQEALFYFYLKKFTIQKFSTYVMSMFKDADTTEEIKKVFVSLQKPLRDSLLQANRQYVSWPSRDLEKPMPHGTGGSVDVWLHNLGVELDMGVPFDWMEKNAGAFYHLKTFRGRFKNDEAVSLHRSIMLYAMLILSKTRFTAYPPEFWHFNHGNQMDSLVTGNIAKYSYIEP